jgi:hypothetical protein
MDPVGNLHRSLVATMPVGKCPGVMVTVVRRIVATAYGGSHHWCQSCLPVWFFLFSVLFSTLFNTHVHAAFGGGGPRWQPLNVTGLHALMVRCQSESVLAGGMVTVAYSCDRTAAALVLRREGVNGGSSGVAWVFDGKRF